MTNYKPTVIVETLNGPLTEDDFVGDAPKVGASDHKYSAADLAEIEKLSETLAEQAKNLKKLVVEIKKEYKK